MKQIAFTLMLFVVVLSPLAAVCQGAALPEAPVPAAQSSSRAGVQDAQQTSPKASPQAAAQSAPRAALPHISDEAWRKVQRIPYGTYIRVTSADGQTLDCNFAGATDAALFCDEPGDAQGTGYQYDRDHVMRVKAVRPVMVAEPEHHRHIGRWITAAVVGTVVGKGVSRNTDAKTGVGVGFAGALVTWAVAENMDHGTWPPFP